MGVNLKSQLGEGLNVNEVHYIPEKKMYPIILYSMLIYANEKRKAKSNSSKNESNQMIRDHTWQDFAANSDFWYLQTANSFDYQVICVRIASKSILPGIFHLCTSNSCFLGVSTH